MKAYVYVDGFNFYYGSLKGTPYKWLNLLEFCKQVLPPAYDIAKIKYFTAHVSGAADPEAPRRQNAYLRALRTIPEVEPHFGSFLAKTIWRPIVNLPVAARKINSATPVILPKGDHSVDPIAPGKPIQVLTVDSYPSPGGQKYRKVKSPKPGSLITLVHTMEEKGSDVNLAVHLLNDAWNGLYDVAIVVSNDTDLITPIDMVVRDRNKDVVIVCTDRKRTISPTLARVATSVRHIRPTILAAAQFPNPIAGISKPADW